MRVMIRNRIYSDIFYNCVWLHLLSWIELNWFLIITYRSSSSTYFSRRISLVLPSSPIIRPMGFSIHGWNHSLNNCIQLTCLRANSVIEIILAPAWDSKAEVGWIEIVFWPQNQIYCYQLNQFLCNELLNDHFWLEELHWKNLYRSNDCNFISTDPEPLPIFSTL